MQELFDEDEFTRWLNQGEVTLKSAEHDLKGGYYNWSCFKSQQASEFAVKALLRELGHIAGGYSVLKLLEKLEEMGSTISQELKSYASTLDRHYIPSSYTNAYPTGSPFEFYDEAAAKDAIKAARRLLEFIRSEREKVV